MAEDNEPLESRVMLVKAHHDTVDDSINLIKVFRLVLGAWKLITGVTILMVLASVWYALTAPEIYQAEAVLAFADMEDSRMASSLGQFGGLASLAGFPMASNTADEEIIATLRSRQFIIRFLSDNNLLPILFHQEWDTGNDSWKETIPDGFPSDDSAYRAFSGIMKVGQTKASGLILLSVYWKDPKLAVEWTNQLVNRLNDDLQRKAIDDSKKRIVYLEQELAKTKTKDMLNVLYSLIEQEKQKEMLANVNDEFALKVIDPAVVPEFRYSPNRSQIVLLGAASGFFLGILILFSREFIRKVRAFPQSETSL
jgi:uncharacterized protein involved in exopolysaccharide biosynthesis